MIERVAGYEVRHLLEKWGEEMTLLAHQASMHRDVLLRVLNSARDQQQAGAFLERARRMAVLDHPNIARLHEAGRDGVLVFCSMEYPGARSLEKVLQERSKLDAAQTVAMAAGVLEALSYARVVGLVHGALRPKMVFLMEERVKVADFGTTVPSEVMLLGDVAQYLSPEHVSGGRVDTRSDIYSLGMMIYRTLSGRLPFSDIDPRSVMRRQVEDSPAPLEQITGGEHPGLCSLVGRAIEKDPRLRYQSPEEMQEALERLGEDDDEPTRKHRSVRKRPSKSRRMRKRH